ncbi:hypothetical protein T03_14259 [Trichinella britovi]|uniref:Uncharacterized protein n=1 Tax=Trichinella britovi TaxID=45882 RepID=A0A0V1AV54_TRIBR|nr:hypothetical protein T03_14200 [Trichinella britovi]KRY43825.1 hypothetical protein T03_14259 [Trichinella britovi]
MDRPTYVSFHPEISTAEDWLQSWLGAFADIKGGPCRTFYTPVSCQSQWTVSSQLVSGTIITSIR